MSFKNINAFRKRLEKRLDKNPDKNLAKALQRSVVAVQDEVISLLSRPGTGIVYPRPTIDHVASSPRMPPASDTGTLRNSITTRIVREKDTLIGQITAFASDGSGRNYAKHLEFGTTRMAKRPFMHPALRSQEGKIRKIFKEQGLIL